MSAAIRRAKRSSPSFAITSRISDSPARASHAETGSPLDGSMRMSSGPSARKLKPRVGSSSCGEETPRSNKMPRTGRLGTSSCTRAAISANGAPTSASRTSSGKRRWPASMAAGSRSNASTRPSGPSAPRMSAVCPPRPNVASMYRPSACTASASNASRASTGMCASKALTPSSGCQSAPVLSSAVAMDEIAPRSSSHPMIFRPDHPPNYSRSDPITK